MKKVLTMLMVVAVAALVFAPLAFAAEVQGKVKAVDQSGRWVTLEQADVLERAAPASGGVMIANPPYGERMGNLDELAAFYPKLGDALKQRFAGWRCYFFTADLRLPKLIRLAPSARTPLWNGAIECRLYEFRMVSGRPTRDSTATRT